MKTILPSLVLALFLPLVGFAIGCGDSTDDSSFSGSCCINGSYYTCDSADGVEKCGSGDTSGCSRDSSKDSDCD